jgi:hypothetical protein
MRVIIAGSRTIDDYTLLEAAIDESSWKDQISVVLCGGARGVDRLGLGYATINNIPVSPFLADWERYGKAAGPIRNEQMAKNADALIAIWDGISKGTKNMIDIAKKYHLKVFIKETK